MSGPGILATTGGVVAKAVPAAGTGKEQEPIRISVQEWAYALSQAGMTDLCSAEANTAGQIPEKTFTILAKMILERPATAQAFRSLTVAEQDQAVAQLAVKLKADFSQYSAISAIVPASARNKHRVACDRRSASLLDRTRPLHITANPDAYTYTLQANLPGQIIAGIVAARRPVPVVSPDTTLAELQAQLAVCEAERAAATTPAEVCLPEVGAYFFHPINVCTTDPLAYLNMVCEQPPAAKPATAPPPTQAAEPDQGVTTPPRPARRAQRPAAGNPQRPDPAKKEAGAPQKTGFCGSHPDDPKCQL